MNDQFDWETAMQDSRRSAAAASRNSENAVAGMGKLLQENRHLSQKVANLADKLTTLEIGLSQLAAPNRQDHHESAGNCRHSVRQLALIFAGGMAVGWAFAGFILSW